MNNRVITKAAALGYGLLGVPFSSETHGTEVEKIRNVCKDAKVDFASRVDLYPRTKDQFDTSASKVAKKVRNRLRRLREQGGCEASGEGQACGPVKFSSVGLQGAGFSTGQKPNLQVAVLRGWRWT